MKIKDRPEFKSKPKPVVCRADQLVSDAVALMATRNIGSVVVVNEGGEVAGIITERDLLRRLLSKNRDQHTTKIADIMTADVKVAHADDEVLDWMRQMSNERFRHVPVVDGGGNLLAVLSQGDFVSYTWPDLLVQATNTAKRAFLSATQVSMIIVVFVAYLVVTLAIVAFR